MPDGVTVVAHVLFCPDCGNAHEPLSPCVEPTSYMTYASHEDCRTARLEWRLARIEAKIEKLLWAAGGPYA